MFKWPSFWFLLIHVLRFSICFLNISVFLKASYKVTLPMYHIYLQPPLAFLTFPFSLTNLLKYLFIPPVFLFCQLPVSIIYTEFWLLSTHPLLTRGNVTPDYLFFNSADGIQHFSIPWTPLSGRP